MNWSEFITPLSLGTLLGAFIKELINFFSSERKHTQELKKRFFDQKFSVTLTSIREIKLTINILHGQLKMIQNVIENDIHLKIALNYSNNAQEILNKMLSEFTGTYTLLEFFGSSSFCVGKNLQIWQKRG